MTTENSIAVLIKDVLRDATTLVQQEIKLGRAEFAMGVEDARAGLLQVVLGLAFAIPAITLLAAAGAITVSQMGGLAIEASLAIAGGLLALLAVLMFLAARRNVGSKNTQMRETTENIEKDAKAVKDALT